MPVVARKLSNAIPLNGGGAPSREPKKRTVASKLRTTSANSAQVRPSRKRLQSTFPRKPPKTQPASMIIGRRDVDRQPRHAFAGEGEEDQGHQRPVAEEKRVEPRDVVDETGALFGGPRGTRPADERGDAHPGGDQTAETDEVFVDRNLDQRVVVERLVGALHALLDEPVAERSDQTGSQSLRVGEECRVQRDVDGGEDPGHDEPTLPAPHQADRNRSRNQPDHQRQRATPLRRIGIGQRIPAERGRRKRRQVRQGQGDGHDQKVERREVGAQAAAEAQNEYDRRQNDAGQRQDGSHPDQRRSDNRRRLARRRPVAQKDQQGGRPAGDRDGDAHEKDDLAAGTVPGFVQDLPQEDRR